MAIDEISYRRPFCIAPIDHDELAIFGGKNCDIAIINMHSGTTEKVVKKTLANFPNLKNDCHANGNGEVCGLTFDGILFNYKKGDLNID